MKVKIQSGTILKREDLVLFLKKLPGSWTREFEKIVVHEYEGKEVVSSFHRKEKEFGIHIPKGYSDSIDDIFDSVAITLQVVRDYGHIPENIPASNAQDYLDAWDEIVVKESQPA